MKYCKQCNQQKSKTEFYKHNETIDKLRNQCKNCSLLSIQKRRKENPEKYKEQCRKTNQELKEYQYFWKAKKFFNLTKNDYLVMEKQQNYKCKICKGIQYSHKQFFCIDHDHKTNKVRGLLCDLCNKGLGHFKDDCNLLRNAIEYLNNN